MLLTLQDLVRFVRPYPGMTTAFERCHYELRMLSVDDALAAITCWDPEALSSVETYAPQKATDETVAEYTVTFPRGPLIVVAYELGTLARIWPGPWSAKLGTRPGSDLVIMDGNRRLAALALRRASGKADDDRLIGAFVGKLATPVQPSSHPRS